MANIAAKRIKREFKEVMKSEEVSLSHFLWCLHKNMYGRSYLQFC